MSMIILPVSVIFPKTWWHITLTLHQENLLHCSHLHQSAHPDPVAKKTLLGLKTSPQEVSIWILNSVEDAAYSI